MLSLLSPQPGDAEAWVQGRMPAWDVWPRPHRHTDPLLQMPSSTRSLRAWPQHKPLASAHGHVARE